MYSIIFNYAGYCHGTCCLLVLCDLLMLGDAMGALGGGSVGATGGISGSATEVGSAGAGSDDPGDGIGSTCFDGGTGSGEGRSLGSATLSLFVSGWLMNRTFSVGSGVVDNGTTGWYFCKNFLFLMVTLPDPSTRMPYWSYCRTSMTTPVLSHLFGAGPVWFCMRTVSPISSGGRRLVCSVSLSHTFMWRFLNASSLRSSTSCHVGCGKYLFGCTGMKSLIVLPNTHIAGDR